MEESDGLKRGKKSLLFREQYYVKVFDVKEDDVQGTPKSSPAR